MKHTIKHLVLVTLLFFPSAHSGAQNEKSLHPPRTITQG